MRVTTESFDAAPRRTYEGPEPEVSALVVTTLTSSWPMVNGRYVFSDTIMQYAPEIHKKLEEALGKSMVETVLVEG